MRVRNVWIMAKQAYWIPRLFLHPIPLVNRPAVLDPSFSGGLPSVICHQLTSSSRDLSQIGRFHVFNTLLGRLVWMDRRSWGCRPGETASNLERRSLARRKWAPRKRYCFGIGRPLTSAPFAHGAARRPRLELSLRRPPPHQELLEESFALSSP
jgi:hypothetical protein